jgi:hypothetical protein
MPATVIDTAILSDYVTDGWNEVILDGPLNDAPAGNERLVAIKIPSTGNPRGTTPSAYLPADPSTLVPPAAGTYYDFVNAPDNSFEYIKHPDAPYRFSCRLNSNDFPADSYAFGTRDISTGQFSVPHMRRNPRIFGVSKKTVRQGDWIFVWGTQLHWDESRSGIFIVRSGIPPAEMPLKPDVVVEPRSGVYFVRPVKVTVPPGIYKLVAHNGDGGQYGWSNERNIVVLGAATPPTATRTVNPGATDVTLDIQTKMNELEGLGGGTLYWPAGTYTLTSTIQLQAKIRNVAQGAVTVNRSHNTGAPMFYPHDDCSFEGFTFEVYPIGGVDAVGFPSLFAPSPDPTYAGEGSDLTLRNCRLVRGYMGQWSSTNFVVTDCVGDRFSINQLKQNSTVYKYRTIGPFAHPIYTNEGRDIAIVEVDFEATERGIVVQPNFGSSSILGYRLSFRDVNQIQNGSEAIALEGGPNWDSIPFTATDPTHITLGRAPQSPQGFNFSIKPLQTHAFFRYAGGQGEAIRITAYDPLNPLQVTLERPRRGTAPAANVELAWGHVESLFVRVRKSGGGTAPGFMLYQGFTHNVVVEDYQATDGGSISFHRETHPSFPRNTQQHNWFNNCQLRLPVWQWQGQNDNPDNVNQLPGGIFYYESSAAYNLISNTVVELPSVNNANQMAMIWEAMGVPVVQRCLGTNSGNLLARSFVKGAKPYILNRGGVLRNCISDYLRVTTSNALGNTRDLTFDGNTPSVSLPLSRISVPPGEAWMCVLNVVARQRTLTGPSKCWSFAFGVQNNNGTTALIGGVQNLITPVASPAWTCTVTADDPNDAIKVQCVGTSGATIDWEGSLDVVRAAP